MSASLYFANLSATTDPDGFWRVFFYAPGMNQWRDKDDAENAKEEYERARAHLK